MIVYPEELMAKRIKELEEALRFYRDATSIQIMEDEGEIARKALGGTDD